MHLLLVLCAVGLVASQTAQTPVQCGQTPIPPAVDGDKVVGGTVATAYSWPWQIVWCENSFFSCSLECGGSVIGANWVITAGHCVYGSTNRPGNFRVKTGVFNEGSTNEQGEVVHSVKKIHLHPQYKPSPVPQHDIALIELSTPITFSDHVQPVCLPSTDDSVIVEPNTAWATGWGATSEGSDISKTLRQVNVPFVNQTTCVREYRNDVQPALMICAGRSGKDTCQGDSGGPLVVQNTNGTWFQYGITSWGQGCAEAGYPGVYGRVSAFCDFINTTTNGTVTCQSPN